MDTRAKRIVWVVRLVWALGLVSAMTMIARVHAASDRPTLRDAVEHRTIAGYDLQHPIPPFMTTPTYLVGWRPPEGYTGLRGGPPGERIKPGGVPRRGPGHGMQYDFTRRGAENGSPETLIFTLYDGPEEAVRALFYAPIWNDDSPARDYRGQAFMTGLIVRDFLGWSPHFGALHRTQWKNVLVGLTTREPLRPEATQLGWIIRLAHDYVGPSLTRDFDLVMSRDVGDLVTLQSARDSIRAALAQADLTTARRGVPLPLPDGAAGEALLAEERPIHAALLKEIQALPADSVAALNWKEPHTVVELAYLRRINVLLQARGDGGRRLSTELRFEIAKRLRMTGKAVAELAQRIAEEDRRALLDLYALEAQHVSRAMIESAAVVFDVSRFERLLSTAKLWQSPRLADRLLALARLNSLELQAAQSPGKAREFFARLPAGAGEDRRLLAERADGLGLHATAAMHWLMLSEPAAQGRARGTREVARLPAKEREQLVALDRARVALLRISGQTQVRYTNESNEHAFIKTHPATTVLGADAAGETPLAEGLTLRCSLDTGLIEFQGERDIRITQERIRGPGRYVQESREASAAWKAWNETVQAKYRQLDYEMARAEASNVPLGTEIKGVDPGRFFMRRSDGSIGEYQLGMQNTYRIGVGEAIAAEGRRIAEAKSNIERLSRELEALHKNAPPGPKTEMVWQEGELRDVPVEHYTWRGDAVRVLTAVCGSRHETYTDRVRFDVAARTDPNKVKVPVRGFKTFEPIKELLRASEQKERIDGLERLTRSIIQARVQTWRSTATGAQASELDLEKTWREWFLGASTYAPAAIALPTY